MQLKNYSAYSYKVVDSRDKFIHQDEKNQQRERRESVDQADSAA